MHARMIKKRIFMKRMRRRPDIYEIQIFYEIKCAAGKTYQTKCAAGWIL